MKNPLTWLRAARHRWKAARLRDSVERDQHDLEEYYAREGFRLSVRANRANWHEARAERLDPKPATPREPSSRRPVLGRGLGDILKTGGKA